MKKRKKYARAKLVKKESEVEESKIIKRDRVRALLIWAICVIILIILDLIVCREYL